MQVRRGVFLALGTGVSVQRGGCLLVGGLGLLGHGGLSQCGCLLPAQRLVGLLQSLCQLVLYLGQLGLPVFQCGAGVLRVSGRVLRPLLLPCQRGCLLVQF